MVKLIIVFVSLFFVSGCAAYKQQYVWENCMKDCLEFKDIRHSSIIVNYAYSPKAVKECLKQCK